MTIGNNYVLRVPLVKVECLCELKYNHVRLGATRIVTV